MKNIYTFSKAALIVAFIAIFSSCKTDLNVNAPYKDTPIVYGLLNQNDSAHYVKITKAFLGEADAYQMAQIRDSSDYGDVLDVKINEIVNENVTKTFNLERTLLKNKQSGVFYSPEHYVYAFTTPITPLNPQAKYELKAFNKNLNTEISAVTDLVHPFTIEKPSEAPKATISYTSISNTTDLKIEWFSAINARRYNITVVFNYKEVDKSSGNIASYDTTSRNIEWSFNLKSKTIKGGEKMLLIMTGDEFFGKIAEEVSLAPDHIERLVHTMDFNFSVAGEELNTYMEVNEPVTGIVQERPEYTNVVNGIGIFSSRLNKSVSNKGVSSGTAKYIKNDETTIGRGFTKYWEVEKGQYLCIDYDPVTGTCE